MHKQIRNYLHNMYAYNITAYLVCIEHHSKVEQPVFIRKIMEPRFCPE